MSSTRTKEQLLAGLLYALAALILVPTFWWGLACGHDTFTHFWRIVQVRLNMLDGAPFLQWGQHFMRGYGYPILPFYAPLMYWLTAALTLLNLEVGAAMRLVAWGSLYLAGWGTYTLGRRYFRPPAAFVAGLAYMFAPYLLYDATQRGALPELLGLALLPWFLAAAGRALSVRTRRATATAAATFALLMLTHNIIPLFACAIALLLALPRITHHAPRITQKRPALTTHPLLHLTLLITLGLTLSAFFWLPAFLELDYTQTRRPNSPFDAWPRFEQHFIPIEETVSLPDDPADPALLNPPLTRTLGVGQAILGALGLLALLKPHPRRRTLLLWGSVVLISLYLADGRSEWAWRLLPLPTFVQLPSRFLGSASLGLALLCAIPIDQYALHITHLAPRITLPKSHFSIVLLFAIAVTLSGWPWLYPQYCPAPQQPQAADLATATDWGPDGRVTGWGGASLGETLPRWVDQLPPAGTFTDAYAAGQPINRLALPDSATLLEWHTGPRGDSYQLVLPAATTLTYRAFYIPGWRATAGGQPLALAPTAGEGLIQLALPAGTHTLTLRYGPTPLRTLMLLLSGLTAAGLLIWSVRGKRVTPDTTRSHTPRRLWLQLALVVAILLGLKAAVDQIDTPLRAHRLRPEGLQGVDVATNIPFGDQFIHLGYSGTTSGPANETFEVTQYWTPQGGIGVPYGFELRVADQEGRVWNRPPERPFGFADFPGPNGWGVGRYARDSYTFKLLPGTPPGVYALEAGIFRRDTDLSLVPATSASPADPAQAQLGRFVVTRPMQFDDALDADTARVDVWEPHALDQTPLTLLGWRAPGGAWRPGDRLPLELLWTAAAPTSEPVTVALQLAADTGDTAAGWLVDVGGTGYPTSQWAPDALVRDQVRWQLPAALESGAYPIWLTYAGQRVKLGTLEIEAPERRFTPPEMEQTADVALGFARLAGYTLPETAAMPAEALALTLLWQARAETAVSYRVFVHVRAPDGRTVAQSDALPAGWTRPTTSWTAGEYIVDTHTLTLPPDTAAGTYAIVTGLYNSATGERLGEARLGTIDVP